MKLTKLLITILAFIFIFLRYLYPVYYGHDTDIFWHLKNGELIFNERHIPGSDPFTYNPADPVREQVILRSSWLADLLFYLFYNLFGFTGLAVLRSFLICAVVLLVFLSMLKRGFFTSIFLSFMLGLALMPMSALRPNLFSFIFAAMLVIFMEKYRETMQKRYQLSLFITMLLWTNMHGGYIIGAGMLIIYLISDLLSCLPLFNKQRVNANTAPFCLTAGAAIGAALINPLGLNIFRSVTDRFFSPANQLLNAHIETEMGFLKILKQHPDNMIFLSVVIAGFILIYSALKITRKKTGIAQPLIIAALLFLSIKSVRALPIFMAAGLILSAKTEGDVLSHVAMGRKKNAALSAIFISVISIFTWNGFQKYHTGRPMETDVVNVRMGDFLAGNRIKGNMLNREFTGNYLIFRLYPDYKVFTDSRYLNIGVLFDGLDMFHAAEKRTGQKDVEYRRALAETCIRILRGDAPKDYSGEYWHALLNKYKIDFIVGSISHPNSGMLFPLFFKLINDDAWKLIYSDGNAVIMIKDNPKNDDVIKKYTPLNKAILYDQAIRENIARLSASAYETLAFAFFMKGDMENAGIFARNALALNKNLKVARECLRLVVR